MLLRTLVLKDVFIKSPSEVMEKKNSIAAYFPCLHCIFDIQNCMCYPVYVCYFLIMCLISIQLCFLLCVHRVYVCGFWIIGYVVLIFKYIYITTAMLIMDYFGSRLWLCFSPLLSVFWSTFTNSVLFSFKWKREYNEGMDDLF